jgi:aryl-alcohol dehydrogenase-like predicted oxidoreductase
MNKLMIALGAMEFGSRVEKRTAFDLLDQYVDAGGEWIDTANCYAFWDDPSGHGGASETLLGSWLAARPGVRDRVKLATKVGCEPTSRGSYPASTEGLSRSAIANAAEKSMRRMGTDHIELYWAHRDDRATNLEETVAAFGELTARGAIGTFGLSNYALWRVERARNLAATLASAPPTALQLRYSYLQPRPFVRDHAHDHRFGWITDEILDYAKTGAPVDLWAYSPLMSGAYERVDRAPHEAFDHPGNVRRLAALTSVATELGISRSAVVVSWLAGGNPSVRPIIGASTPSQLATALEGARLILDPTTRATLDNPW